MNPLVCLSPVRPSDADDLFAAATEPSLFDCLDEEPPTSVDALAERF